MVTEDSFAWVQCFHCNGSEHLVMARSGVRFYHCRDERHLVTNMDRFEWEPTKSVEPELRRLFFGV